MLEKYNPWQSLIASVFMLVLLAIASPRLVYAAPTAQTEFAPAQLATPEFATDGVVRVMVKVDPEVMAARIQTASAPTVSATSLAKLGWEVIELEVANADATITELQAMQGVVEITPDYPLELAWNPDDPAVMRGEQWALDKIGAEVAWEFSAGQSIIVAVIDSGIDQGHPDLQGRIIPGYNFIDDNEDVTDRCGHGTHVAGIVAATANNTIGVAGVAHQALLMPVKVIGDNCLGSYARLMEGIIWAVDNGARIISITSGGGYEHEGLREAIAYANSQGVLVAVAAGNRGNDQPFYPGSFPESFTVGGTDANDQPYSMSNFGEQIDISAPATNILSTHWTPAGGSAYAYMTGTSMATPHVAAVAALVLAMDPQISLTELEDTLKGAATDLGEEGWDPNFGAGRVTAWAAVASVSPVASNLRLGHYRVPVMGELVLDNVTIAVDAAGILLNWTQENVAADHSIVIYRAPVPVFEAAEDIAELPAATQGSYLDTDVAVDQEYYYWLIEANHDVEVTTTPAYMIKLTAEVQNPTGPEAPVDPEAPTTPEAPTAPHDPVVPETPEGPQQPTTPEQPVIVAMFMPYLGR